MNMKKVAAATAALIAPIFAAGAAQAAVTVSDTQTYTTDGETLSYTFTGLSSSTGVGSLNIAPTGFDASNTFAALGLDLDGTTEFFELTVDGTSFGTFNCTGAGGNQAIAGSVGGIDCTFSLDVALDSTFLTSILADGSVIVELAFTSDVNAFADMDEVTVSLTFDTAAVPLPAGFILFAPAAAGLAALRRRKAKSLAA